MPGSLGKVKKKALEKINMEAENPLIEKENHLNLNLPFFRGVQPLIFLGFCWLKTSAKNPAIALESRKSLMDPEKLWPVESSGLGGLLMLNICCFLDQDPNKRYIYIIIYLYII